MATSIGYSRDPTNIDDGETRRTSRLLKHLSEPVRLRLILLLTKGEYQVEELSDRLNESRTAVSFHLALLRHGGIVLPRREGDRIIYRLTESGAGLAAVVTDWMRSEESASTEVDWSRIDRAIQRTLDELAEDLRGTSPPIWSVSGSTSGRAFPLYSYRTFHPQEGQDIDPIVVGVTFDQAADGISVRGDIGGEESGSVLYEVEPRTVPPEHRAVLDAAEAVALELSRHPEVVRNGLSPTRPEAGRDRPEDA